MLIGILLLSILIVLIAIASIFVVFYVAKENDGFTVQVVDATAMISNLVTSGTKNNGQITFTTISPGSLSFLIVFNSLRSPQASPLTLTANNTATQNALPTISSQNTSELVVVFTNPLLNVTSYDFSFS
jgi:hypothetical protein